MDSKTKVSQWELIWIMINERIVSPFLINTNHDIALFLEKVCHLDQDLIITVKHFCLQFMKNVLVALLNLFPTILVLAELNYFYFPRSIRNFAYRNFTSPRLPLLSILSNNRDRILPSKRLHVSPILLHIHIFVLFIFII